MSVEEAIKIVQEARSAAEGYLAYGGEAYYAIQKADELLEHLKANKLEESRVLISELATFAEAYRYVAPDVIMRIDQLKELKL